MIDENTAYLNFAFLFLTFDFFTFTLLHKKIFRLPPGARLTDYGAGACLRWLPEFCSSSVSAFPPDSGF